jgi:FkbH-like protein
VFVHDLIPPAASMDGLLGARVFDWTMELNAGLRRMAAGMESVFVPGAAQAAGSGGFAGWRDPRFWYLARVGINPKKFPILATHLARCLAALRRPAAKCVVFDLDNTIWGGVLGDAGPRGILCGGTDYPSGAYADFQRSLLALRGRGILLAVASKNDWPLVEEAFRVRGDMPLRPEHIAAWEVHWNPKPDSLDRIAARLNIGIDSLVFLDDNPAEVDLVRMSRPAVRAHLLPPRPEAFIAFLSKLEDFDQLRLSDEDRRRAELYQLRAKQAVMAASATDLESFYRSLKTVLIPEAAGAANFDRIVQLIQKTNQFNLTTRRHDTNALNGRLGRGSELWGFRASDVHGDHGLIAVALLDFEGDSCSIDTLLMSCRVIGRTLETAVLHFLEGRALARGARVMRGEYLPTAKNGPCREFYRQHGFSIAAEDDRHTEWSKNLENRTGCPEWIAIGGELTEVCAKT